MSTHTKNRALKAIVAGTCMAWLIPSSLLAAKTRSFCPAANSGHAILAAADEAAFIASVQFLKVEKTPAEPNIWKFKSTAVLKPDKDEARGPFSFFAKPADTEGIELRLNDRFVVFSTKKDIDLSSTMKQFLLHPGDQAKEYCIINSNVYLEEFIKRGARVESGRDNVCRIQVRNLETNPLINDALNFRCKNIDLEKRRIEQLAMAYAKAKRYGNAVVALELVNGTLNANTLSIALGWADEWQKKDERSAKRFVERLLSEGRREHFASTGQMRAMKDIIEDKKRFKNLRDTDWFPGLAKQWVEGVTEK